MNLTKTIVVILIASAVVLAFVWNFQRQQSKPSKSSHIPVDIPVLSEEARAGRTVFSQHCETCHGPHAAGTNQGPPLIHKIYEPGHHADLSFYRAVHHGVRQHHWPYGSMPAIAGVTEGDVSKIIRFDREIQKAIGVF